MAEASRFSGSLVGMGVKALMSRHAETVDMNKSYDRPKKRKVKKMKGRGGSRR